MSHRLFVFWIVFSAVSGVISSSVGQGFKQNDARLRQLFSNASEIKLYSYTDRNMLEVQETEESLKDTVRIVIKDIRIRRNTIKEVITLSKNQGDAFVKLLTDHTPVKNGGIRGVRDVMMCYMPRHAVVLYDASAQAIGYVEVCLECGNYQTYPKFDVEFYSDRVGVYEKLFQSFGVKYFGQDEK